VLVATLILGVAVVGLLSGISTSIHNAARLTDYDRVALLARARMDALLADRHLPEFSVLQGNFDPSLMRGVQAGWRVRVTPFEIPLAHGPGARVLERLELEVWWMAGSDRRTFTLEAYRRKQLLPQDTIALSGPTP